MNSEDGIKAAIVEALNESQSDRSVGLEAERIGNILEFVDSFGFVQLIMDIENRLKIEVDLTDVDLGSIVEFDNLVQFFRMQKAKISP